METFKPKKRRNKEWLESTHWETTTHIIPRLEEIQLSHCLVYYASGKIYYIRIKKNVFLCFKCYVISLFCNFIYNQLKITKSWNFKFWNTKNVFFDFHIMALTYFYIDIKHIQWQRNSKVVLLHITIHTLYWLLFFIY